MFVEKRCKALLRYFENISIYCFEYNRFFNNYREAKILKTFNKDLTFVICAYRKSPYLEECIRSCIHQNVQAKVILYTSTPNKYIENLVNKYNLSYYIGRTKGIGANWNEALGLVKTKYAVLAHHDDIYLPNYVEELQKFMNRESNPIIFISDYEEFKDGKVVNPRTVNLKIKTRMLWPLQRFSRSKWLRKRIFSFGSPICCPAVCYNLEKLNVWGFKFNEEMKVSLDWEAWYRMAEMDGSFCFINKALVWHCIHQESATTETIADNTRTREDLLMFEKYWPKFIARFLMRFYVKSQETNQ